MKYDSAINSMIRECGGVIPISMFPQYGLPKHVVRLGRKAGWQRVWPGIYVPQAGELSFEQWVAVGRQAFGRDAAVGGSAALYQMGVLTQEPQIIEFWTRPVREYRIPPGCPLRPRRDYDGRLDRLPNGYGHTCLVDALIDYMNTTRNEINVAGVVIRARKLVSGAVSQLVDALAAVPRLRHRRLAEGLLLTQPAFDSPLEWLWVKLVQEPHRIEEPIRQWRCPEGFLRDNSWPAHKAIVELDGDAFHTDVQAVGRDRQKDRLMAKHGFVTLRFGYWDVKAHACETARELAEAVPTLQVYRCDSPACRVVE